MTNGKPNRASKRMERSLRNDPIEASSRFLRNVCADTGLSPVLSFVTASTQARGGGWRRTRTRPQTGGRLPPSKHHGLSVCLSFAFIVRIL